MKHLTKSILTSLLLIATVNANATTISITPSNQEVLIGNQVLLNIFYDTEGIETTGGAFSVNFDNNAFKFTGIEFDGSLPDDPLFRVFPVAANVNGSAFNLGFGSFSGINGTGKVATLTFMTEKEGLFDFFLAAPLPGDDSFAEGASYLNAQVQVNAVPLPAASWLLLSSFASLVAVRRRKHIA